MGGGDITVHCSDSADNGGTLIVQENYFSGWKAWMDGKRVPLETDTYHLTVKNVPGGDHEFQFKYMPWDIWVGFSMTFLGILYSLYIGGVFKKIKYKKV